MASRERVGVIGARRGRQQLVTALADFREGRLQGSISQAQVAAAIGRSRTWVTWTEGGQNQRLSVVELSQLLACVGLELSVRAYPAGRGLRDEPQLRLLAGLRQLVQHAWRWRGEVGMPLPGDLRAWDAALSNGRCEIGVDAETRLRDLQAVDRRIMLKLRDSGYDRAILLLSPTRANRDALREHHQLLSANYPVSGRAALAALRAGRDPGGNAIIVLPPKRRNPEPRAGARESRSATRCQGG